MAKWEEWISFGDKNGGVAFPQLEELCIYNCPKLIGGLPVHLPSLAILDINNCRQLVASLPSAPAISELRLHYCNEVLLNDLPTGMQKLEIGRFDVLEFLPEGMINSNGDLQELTIHDCFSLISLPKDGPPSTLKPLEIERCMKLELPTHLDYSSLENLVLSNCDFLESFPLDLFTKLYCIKIKECSNFESLTIPKHYEHDLVTLEIEIAYCPNFVSFPKGGLRAPSLTSFCVRDYGNLRSLHDKMHILVRSLEELQIINCTKVESFLEGDLPSNQKSIVVDGCDKLVASQMGWGLQNLPFLRSLSIGGKSEDVEFFQEVQLLPTSLTYLSISHFPNLKSLDKKGLQHLNALEELRIFYCPNLKYMLEQGLPPSLSILNIYDCPLLKKRWQSKKGKEWSKIAHVEWIWIDHNLIE